MHYRTLKSLIVASAAAICFTGSAVAELSPPERHITHVNELQGPDADVLRVPIFKSKIVTLDRDAARVSVGNPEIADILILRANRMYFLGKDLGTTNVLVWDKNDRLIGSVALEVTHDIDSLKFKLHEIMPQEPIEVHTVQRSIILKGRVSNVENMDAAMRLAEGFLKTVDIDDPAGGGEKIRRSDGKVINMMHIGGAQQVMLELKVAEMARRELKRINAQFNAIGIGDNHWTLGGVNGGATFPDLIAPTSVTSVDGAGNIITRSGDTISALSTGNPWGPAVDVFQPDDMFIENQGAFASFMSETFLFNSALDIAKENGMAKVLAEPTLTTLTGSTASFNSGGEFPIPVPRGDNGITIEFKEFGVNLDFTPIVLGSGNINVNLDVEVSEVSTNNTVGINTMETNASFIIPSVVTRKASSMVELKDGQTMGIAGLINENMREIVTKFPGLGDVPVLGALFRSQEYVNNESELVIMVTPRLAKPMNPEDVKLPTDAFIEPSDVDFYLFGRLEGVPQDDDDASNASVEQTDGSQDVADASYGHQVQ